MAEQNSPETEEREAEVYDRVVENLRKILSTTGELTRDGFDRALKKAGTSVDEATKFTKDEINRAKEAVRKDWQVFLNIANKKKAEFFQSEQFVKFADTSLGALAKLSKSIKDWASFVDEKVDQQVTYHTGEVAGAGTFECVECGKTLTLKKSGRIPPCSSCKSTTFRRKI